MENYIGIIISFIGVLSVFVEVSKIKFNPWRTIFDFIGKSLNRDVKKELESIQGMLQAHNEYLKEIETTVDMNEIKRIRAEIFSFADSCKMGERHTEDGFLHIIDIHEDYETLLEKYNMKNGRISVDYDYIMKVYRDCVAKKLI